MRYCKTKKMTHTYLSAHAYAYTLARINFANTPFLEKQNIFRYKHISFDFWLTSFVGDALLSMNKFELSDVDLIATVMKLEEFLNSKVGEIECHHWTQV